MNKHLTIEERYQIWSLNKSGKSNGQISIEIKKHKTTVSRELKRNRSPGGYDPKKANEKAVNRKKSSHKRKKFREKMKVFVEEKIRENWSPEQIAGYCKKHSIDMVSHQRIYQHITEDKQENGDLYKHLRHAKKRRKKYGTQELRGQLKNRRSIDDRPKIVADKERFGDWEADTIIGKNQKGCAVTLVERKTKLTFIVNTKSKKAEKIKEAIVKKLTPLKNFCHTITFDNGKEFALHKEIEKKLNVKTYFAHPYSSYERGLNENTNGLIRQYIPKKIDFRGVTDDVFEEICKNLNSRPRKTLDFRSPFEALLQLSL